VPLYRQAIEPLELHGPGEKLEAAYLHNNLAMILKGWGDYAAAELHYLAALNAFQEGLGEYHSTVATVLNNLGGLYTFTSRPEEAEAMLQTFLADSSTRRGAECLRPSAILEQSCCRLPPGTDDYSRARIHYEQARQLFERNLHGGEGDYAIAMRNFAALYREQGDEKNARKIEEAARAKLGAQWEA